MRVEQETLQRALSQPSAAAVLVAQREVERTRIAVERDQRLLKIELQQWGYAETFRCEPGSVVVQGKAFSPVPRK
jgi:hypothetical protein